MKQPTVADLLAIAPNPVLFSPYALAAALRTPISVATQLRNDALALQTDVSKLMSNCQINQHEAEAYLGLSAGSSVA